MRRHLTCLIAVVALAAASAPPALASTVTVEVGQGGIKYTPPSPTINPGDTIHWDWQGQPHSVTSGATAGHPNGLFDSGVQDTGATLDRTFNTPGTYHYFCRIHGSGMTGTIVVTGSDSQPTAAFTPGSATPTAGQVVSFDASGSSASDGDTIDSYTWDFGDGTAPQTVNSAVVTHKFAGAGPVNVTLTVTDAGSATSVAVGMMLTVQPAPPGSGGGGGGHAASLTGLHLAHKRFCTKKSAKCSHPGTSLQFTLSAASPVALVLRRHGKTVRHSSLSGVAGQNSVRFKGGGLKPGKYVLSLTPSGGSAVSVHVTVIG